jgi:hypothetical protein
MIFQAQSRLIFGVQGEDADILAHELASLTYDPMRIKDEIFNRRQLVTGHRTVELASWSAAEGYAQQWQRDYGQSWSQNRSSTMELDRLDHHVISDGQGSGGTSRRGEGGSTTSTSSHGGHQSLVPVYDEFLGLSRRTYVTFEEHQHLWEQKVRRLARGIALLRLVDNDRLFEVAVKRSAPGHLRWDLATIARELPQAIEEVERLIEGNFQSDLFLSPGEIDRETERRIQHVIRPTIRLASPPAQVVHEASVEDPFRNDSKHGS